MAHPANVATATAAASGVTLGDLIVQALTRHSSSEAFVAGDRRLTYAQVRDLVSRYMTVLARRGVGLSLHPFSPAAGLLDEKAFFGADYPMLGHERLVNDWREQGYS